MVEPGPPVSGAALATRLRELRRSGFPDARPLTQRELAHALSEDKPVGNSTLSSWENAETPTFPKPDRLSAYARFFATKRSLEGKPHLVPLNELSPSEERAREELERELVKLRDDNT